MDPKGQGADLSFAGCQGSFDGEAACGVNDTIFVNSRVGNKGGSVSLSGGNDPWNVAFHKCTVENSTAGLDFKDDPQGEGGAFSVGEGVTLLVADCTFKGSSCGKKVCIFLAVRKSRSFREGRETYVVVGLENVLMLNAVELLRASYGISIRLAVFTVHVWMSRTAVTRGRCVLR